MMTQRSTPTPRSRRALRFLVWLGLVMLTASCRQQPDNCHPEFDKGERFRVTIIERMAEVDGCAPLQPGDSFDLVAGALEVRDTEPGCAWRTAAPELPAFFEPYFEEFEWCTPTGDQLGLFCRGRASECGEGERSYMTLNVGTEIRRTDTVIEDGILGINWQLGCAHCLDGFHVRIEILNRLPGGAASFDSGSAPSADTAAF